MSNNLTEKERTFLVLKYGGHYRTRIIDAWYASNTAQFAEVERKIVIDYIRRTAGIK